MALQLTNIYQAKTNLSQLVNLALAGEDVVIAKAGKPVVKLVPYIAEKKPRTFGKFKGQITIAEDFDEEDEEINKLFYDGDL
ncbi:type II toxin-antitoxin system prevent-host-death family antitoxin [Candidatus Gottesmanbacteria bacterium]|nr:type II toxin-antitoxin system prevent-host-death family antitoxin [Candidatus Gottesmanbacteria bacterium]